MFLFLLFFVYFSFAAESIVAKVNGKVITKEEFESVFQVYWKEMLHFSPKKPTPEDKRLFLFEYIKGLIIEDLAKSMGIEVSEEEAVRELKTFGRNPEPILVELARRELIVKALEERLAKNISVSDGEVEAYYLLNRREFYYPDQVKLLRVVADSREKANEVYKRLKRGGIPEEVEGVIVGREHWYSIQALPRRIRRGLYPYNIGSVSRPIELETGYLILKITDKRKAGVLPLSEVREQVRRKILRIKKQEVLEEWFREVLKSYRLELYLKNL
ncbi:SurA-like protein [Hydrogenivirga caldilitoris]|uniref:peptidylprolyl isomerase n=1 Tax=Hydrogenivirga caldilitoris TaxID=246264 RepID=A0A497XVW5_9AQUI|nr:peptidyl-prolyl cis-trans isomerase [Hydrogenivirga caldilitoris]RLJ71302.1 SurA-like protein [Hydrogenivirga caldilitoris]